MLSAPRSRPSGAIAVRIPQPRRNQPRRRGRSHERTELPAKFHQTIDGFWTDSEEEVASMLTAGQYKFRYEPTTFQLSSSSAFKPDFYLVDEDIYIEVTAGNHLRQQAKHKKIRRAEALYGVSIRLIGPIELFAIRNGDLTLWDVVHRGDDPGPSDRKEQAMTTHAAIGTVGRD